MKLETYKARHRLARMGNLGVLACSMQGDLYQWFLREVYDIRFPHVGDERHMRARTFDSLRGKLAKCGPHTYSRTYRGPA